MNTTPENAAVARVQRFIARWQTTHPHRATVWTDCSDHAAGMRVADLELLLVLVAAHETETTP